MARIHAALWNRLSNRSVPSAAKSGKRPVAQMALLPPHGAVGVWNTGVSRPELPANLLPSQEMHFYFLFKLNESQSFPEMQKSCPLTLVLIILPSDESQGCHTKSNGRANAAISSRSSVSLLVLCFLVFPCTTITSTIHTCTRTSEHSAVRYSASATGLNQARNHNRKKHHQTLSFEPEAWLISEGLYLNLLK